MLLFPLLVLSIPIGLVTLLCVAAGNVSESDPHSRIRAWWILAWGVIVLLVAMGVAAIGIVEIVNSGRIDDSEGAIITAAIALSLLMPTAVLLILLALSLMYERPRVGRLGSGTLRVILMILSYILCFIAPMIAFPPLAGLGGAALISMLAFLRLYREGDLLWMLTTAVERDVPVPEELDAFADAVSGPTGAKLRRCADGLYDGLSLSQALSLYPAIVSPPAALAIRIGEQTGRLPEALRSTAQRTIGAPGSESRAAYTTGLLAYLVMMVFMLCGIVGFVMYYIVPKFKAIFDDFDVELPWMTVLVIEASDFVVDWWFLLGPLLPVIFVACIVLTECHRRGWKNVSMSWLTRWFPRTDTPDLLRNLAQGVHSGTPLAALLPTLARHHHRSHIRRRMERVATQVEQGGDPWTAMGAVGLLRPREVELLQAAAGLGNLGWGLDLLADRIDQRRRQRMQWWFEVLRPWPVLLLAGVAMLFVVGMFLPLVKLIHELS